MGFMKVKSWGEGGLVHFYHSPMTIFYASIFICTASVLCVVFGYWSIRTLGLKQTIKDTQ